jgi:hypothetical protein
MKPDSVKSDLTTTYTEYGVALRDSTVQTSGFNRRRFPIRMMYSLTHRVLEIIHTTLRTMGGSASVSFRFCQYTSIFGGPGLVLVSGLQVMTCALFRS